MRKEYDFSKAKRRRYAEATDRPASRAARTSGGAEEDFELTGPQLRELDRRVRDADDRTRFLIAGALARRFILYYEVASDTYVMNDPLGATLFKRELAARAVMATLGSDCQLIRCRVDRAGKLVKSSVRVRQRKHAKRRAGVA